MRQSKRHFEDKATADEYIRDVSGYPYVVYMRATGPYFDRVKNKWAVDITEYELD